MILERPLKDGFRIFALFLGQLCHVDRPGILQPRLQNLREAHPRRVIDETRIGPQRTALHACCSAKTTDADELFVEEFIRDDLADQQQVTIGR
jgi:hypothetical protein